MQYFTQAISKNLFPRTKGFVPKTSESTERMYFDGCYMNDAYVNSLSEGIKVKETLRELTIRSACISTHSALKLLQAVNFKNLLTIDFSHNPQISQEFYEEVNSAMAQPHVSVQNLIFEGNKMKDKNCIALCQTLYLSKTLKVLNLNKNELTDASCDLLGKLIDICGSLHSLFLHYNKIMGKGATILAQNLSTNSTLRVLDLSHN